MFEWLKKILLNNDVINNSAQDNKDTNENESTLSGAIVNEIQNLYNIFTEDIKIKFPQLFCSKWYYQQNSLLSNYYNKISVLKSYPNKIYEDYKKFIILLEESYKAAKELDNLISISISYVKNNIDFLNKYKFIKVTDSSNKQATYYFCSKIRYIEKDGDNMDEVEIVGTKGLNYAKYTFNLIDNYITPITNDEFKEYFLPQVATNIGNILEYDKYKEFYTNEFKKSTKIN